MAKKSTKGLYTYEYPHPAITADCVVFGYDNKTLKVLLVKRGVEKDASTSAYTGEWALPGGFMNVLTDETIAHTASRELKEETGLDILPENLKEFRTFSKIDRDPRERVVTIAHYALVKIAEVRADTDAEKAEWFSLPEVPSLAFDHDDILAAAEETIRQRIHFEPVGFDLLPDVFTIPELQNLYESILGVTFDRWNFSKKIKKLELLDEYDDGTVRNGSRNPIKYTFNKSKYDQLKSEGFRLEF